MKQDLKKLNKESQQRVLEALFRLSRRNNDFKEFMDFARYSLEIRKKDLINVEESRFKQLQGEAFILSEIFELLELAEKEGSK